MAMVPKAGCAGFSTALLIAVAGVLENLGVPVNDTLFLPGKDKVNELLTERAVDSIIEVQESIRKNPFVFISADKGNKAGNKNLAKYICNHPDGTVYGQWRRRNFACVGTRTFRAEPL